MQRLIAPFVQWSESHKQLAVLLTIVSLALTLYPRFNARDVTLIQPFVGVQAGELALDAEHYVRFVEHFRGNLPIDSVDVPFSYRPLVPMIASIIPAPPLLAINIVNSLALVMTLLCLFYILKAYQFRFGMRIIGCMLYAVSFPVFYYGAAGFIDASVVCVISVFALAVIRWHYVVLFLLIGVGTMTKESTILVLPFVLSSLYLQRRMSVARLALFFLGAIGIYLITIRYCRTTYGTEENFFWSPSFDSLVYNLSRMKSYISLVLSFGVLGVIAMQSVLSNRKQVRAFWKQYQYTPHVIGALSGTALALYAFFSAHADGRFIWTAYPHLIVLATHYLNHRGKSCIA